MWKKQHLERFRNSILNEDSQQTIRNKYTALNVSCEEKLLNNKVLRVELERCNFQGFEKNTCKKIVQKKKHVFEKNYNGIFQINQLESVNKNTLKNNKVKNLKNNINKRFLRLTRSRSNKSVSDSVLYLSKRVPKINTRYTDFVTAEKQNLKSKVKSSNKNKKQTNFKHQKDSVSKKLNGKLKSDNSQDIYQDFDIIYCLNMYLSRSEHPKKIKTNVDFVTLTKSLKNIKLPSVQWKIKVIIKNKIVNQIIFTNNQKFERCVKFYRTNNMIDITFDNNDISLIAAPTVLQSLSDIVILLNIIHHINQEDPIIQYEKK